MFEGTTTALITPFLENGEVDYEGLVQNVKFQLENGVDNLLPLGTTGETPTLTEDEQTKIVETVIANASGAKVIVGIGTNSTTKTVKNAKHAEELGANGLLVVTPYYNKPPQEGIFQHFKAVHDSCSLPIVVYNIKGRTGVNIETSTMKRIAQLDRIMAVKEASGDINQMKDVLEQTDLTVLSGDDAMTFPLMEIGGKGVICVTSNLVPGRVTEMVNAALEGNFEQAKKLHNDLLPFFTGLFVETNPIPVKAAMNLMGMPAGSVRLPLVELQPENMEKVKKLVSGLK